MSRGFQPLVLSGFLGLAPAPVPAALCQQTFPTDVTLVAVDASVVDRDGRPVSDLRPEEFLIEVDGRTRRLVSAEFLRHAPLAGAVEPLARTAPVRQFASNQQGPIGRLVVLVPDVGNLSPGGARGAIEAARRFLDRLEPEDRVALVPIPVGPSVDFTADHARLREALTRVTGGDRSRGVRSVSLAEAFAFMNQGRGGDSRLWANAISRECALARRQQELLACRSQCEGEAADLYQSTKATSAQSVAALRRLLRSLAAIQAPKTVVLLSQKLVTGSSLGEAGTDRALADVGEAAAEARATLYTIHIDRAFLEAFDVREYTATHTALEDARLHTDGLVAVAGHTGGQLFKVVASADVAFDRIAAETSGSWLLSFEPQGRDGDGRPHEIRVGVSRDALQVRARPRFVVNAAQLQASAADLARRELDSPLPARALTVSVGAFNLTRPSGGGVSLLLAAEIGGARAEGLAVAYRLVDAKGGVQGESVDAPSFRRKQTTAGERLYYTSTRSLAPGRYRLRFAVADSRGRAGGVELLVDAQLRASGSLEFSDLLVAESRTPGQVATLSLTGSVAGGSVRAYVEMVGPAQAEVSQVLFELCPGVDAPARIAALASLTPRDDGGRHRADAVMDLTWLPPGDYVLRALASQGQTALGQIERPLRLEPFP